MHDISTQVERMAWAVFAGQEPVLLREDATGRELYLRDPVPTYDEAHDFVSEFVENSEEEIKLTFGPRKLPGL